MSFSVKICGTAQSTLKSEEVCPPLSHRLTQLGFVIEDSSQKAEFFISFNHDRDLYNSFSENGGNPKNAALIRLEPAAVFPAQYMNRVERLYGAIITPGSSTSLPTFPWPYYFNQNPLQPDVRTPSLESVVSDALRQNLFEPEQWGQRPIVISLIASNKVSPAYKNNYKLRRKFARALPEDVLQIYGGLWNSPLIDQLKHRAGVLSFALHSRFIPNLIEIYGKVFTKYPSAKGTVDNKHEIIEKSKFSLVIENDNSYVSEKLIDALVGGSIPIYFGGDTQITGIPKELVFTNLKNEVEVMSFIANFSEQDLLEFQLNLKQWLQSSAFHQLWAGDFVFASIADEIAEKFRNVVP